MFIRLKVSAHSDWIKKAMKDENFAKFSNFEIAKTTKKKGKKVESAAERGIIASVTSGKKENDEFRGKVTKLMVMLVIFLALMMAMKKRKWFFLKG